MIPFLIVTGAPAQEDSSKQLRSWLVQRKAPHLKTCHPVENLTLAWNGIQFSLKQGHGARIAAGNEVVGLFFEGEGSFRYRSATPREFAVLDYNCRQQTNLDVKVGETDRQISGSFNRILIWMPEKEIPMLKGQPGKNLTAAFKQHRDEFKGDIYTRGAHFFYEQKLDYPDAILIKAQFQSGNDPLVYFYDGTPEPYVSLFSLQKSSARMGPRKDHLFPVTLSHYAATGDGRGFTNPFFRLTDLDYQLKAEGSQVTLDVKQTLVPLYGAKRVFKFNLPTTLFSGRNSTRELKLKRVTDASGNELEFDHRNQNLVVVLPRAIPENQSFQLHFAIEGDFLIRPGGDSFWTLGTWAWFPQPPLGGQYYRVRSKVSVKKPFVPFAIGKTLDRGEEGDFNYVVNQVDKPVQFAVVLAGKYHVYEETFGHVTIRVASYAVKKKRSMKKLAKLAGDIINYYEPWLGPFPFPELNILEINSLGFGQAPPGTMFITQEAFSPRQDDISKIFSKGVNARFAHEIAHQYWGHVIKMGSFEEQWLTESFAEYCSAIVVEQIKGKQGYKAMVQQWKSNAKQAAHIAAIPVANRIRGKDPLMNRIHRTYLLYDKGAYLLSVLNRELGDRTFFTFMRAYQDSLAWKYGTTPQVVDLLNHLTGKDYGPFFEKYYWDTGMPD